MRVAKVVVTDLNSSKKKKLRGTDVTKLRVKDGKGGSRTVYRIDAGSPRFDLEFSKAFSLSIARARKENKRVTGQADVDRTDG